MITRQNIRYLALVPLLAVASFGVAFATPSGAQGERVRLGVSSPWVKGTSVEERITGLESDLNAGHLDAVRLYHAWDEWFPQGGEQFLTDAGRDTVPVLSVNTVRRNGQRVWWKAIALAKPGSQLHNEMRRWADDLRDFGRPIVVSLNHEPDHYRNGGTGSPYWYRRAYQTFVSILRNRGATNVDTSFVGVAWNFDPRSPVDINEWYPGDWWVDVIGVDGYDWGKCNSSNGQWRTFDQIFAPFLNWIESHPHKPVMIAEFGVTERAGNPGYKPNWLRNAAASLDSSDWDRLDYVLAWDNKWEHNSNCDFRVSSSSQVRTAFRDMMQSPAFN